MDELIECVPNLSEGRRPEVVEAAAAAVRAVPGVLLLDSSGDADHNRSVLTMVGTRAGLTEAVRAVFRVGVDRIDLNTHRGEHPRIGAIDVVPFIPVRGASIADCVALSREVGQMIAAEFGVPVYLYAESAASATRKVLSNIRKGEFEGLSEKMKDPAWKPDFGPVSPHPSAGAVAVGARFYLIAYNLQLDTAKVEVANAVARAVRASSGGLHNVQALGFTLAERNQAQVSINLLNYEQTPLHDVQESVKTEAAKYGAKVIGTEIVGLIPQAALNRAAAHYLQIEGFRENLVLENAIAAKQGSA